MFVKVKSKRRFRNIEKQRKSPRGQYNFPDYTKPLKFPEYASSKSKNGSVKKFIFFAIQIVFSLGCLGGFICQSYSVISFFLTYPTRMETVTSYDPVSLKFPPAITIANTNRFLKSYWAKVLVDVNVSQTPSSWTWIQRKYIRESLPNTDLKSTGHSLKSLLKNCTDLDACSHATWIWSEDRGNSYVIYANYTGTARKLIRYNPSDASGNSNVINFEVGFQSEEYVPSGNSTIKPSAKMYIHSSLDLVSFGIPEYDFKEIRVEAGKKYYVTISLERYNYLPEPYWTNCKDYDVEFLEKGKRGPISKLTCLREFYIQKSLNICGCVPEFYSGPIIPLVMNDINNKTCTSVAKSDSCWKQIMKNDSMNKFGFSKHFCQRDCRKIMYSVTTETQRMDPTFTSSDGESYDSNRRGPIMEDSMERSGEFDRGPDSRGPDGRGPHSFFNMKTTSTSLVYITYASPKVTIMTYEAQYKINNVIADVGGFLGLWLGVSFLSIPKVFFQTIMFYRALKTGTFN